jgi:NAD(P)-dependent dehydrogenase (short-subunit alcohol dehydrogenase family)
MHMSTNFQGKVAIITGGGRGIGAATARAFAAAGSAVVVAARSKGELDNTASQVIRHGGRAIGIRTDVTDEASVASLINQTVTTFGRLDFAINCAGGGGSRVAGLADLSTEDFSASLALNLNGVFFAMKYEIPAMLKTGHGSIVNISSIAGLAAPAPGVSPYVAGKHGVEGLTKVAALDYATQGIRVNSIAPGPIDTGLLAAAGDKGREWAAKMVPMQRLGRPEEVAAAALWLCSEAASFVSGATLRVDGGLAAK